MKEEKPLLTFKAQKLPKNFKLEPGQIIKMPFKYGKPLPDKITPADNKE